MKFLSPPHCSVLVHDGQTFPVARDGSVDIPDELTTALLAHGVAPWVQPELALPLNTVDRPATETMSRSAVLAALAERGVPLPYPTSLVACRKALRDATAER